MNTESHSPLTPKRVLLYVFAYVLWLVTIVACIVAVIQLRSAVNALLAALGGSMYSVNLVNQVTLLLAGLAAFAYAVFLEGYYRESIARTAPARASSVPPQLAAASWRSRLSRWLSGVGLVVLLRRFAVATAIPLAVILLSLGLLELSLRVLP